MGIIRARGIEVVRWGCWVRSWRWKFGVGCVCLGGFIRGFLVLVTSNRQRHWLEFDKRLVLCHGFELTGGSTTPNYCSCLFGLKCENMHVRRFSRSSFASSLPELKREKTQAKMERQMKREKSRKSSPSHPLGLFHPYFLLLCKGRHTLNCLPAAVLCDLCCVRPVLCAGRRGRRTMSTCHQASDACAPMAFLTCQVFLCCSVPAFLPMFLAAKFGSHDTASRHRRPTRRPGE